MKRSDKKTKNRHMQITRHIIQVIAFIAFPELFITVYVSIKDIVTSIIGGTFSFAGNASSLILTSGILLVTALWGRFFCGYLCAFGAVSELMYSVFNKRIIKKTLMPTSVDSKLKWVKYVVLAAIVTGMWILALPVSSSFSPWNAFGGLTSGSLETAASVISTAGFAILLIILTGSALVERFFCRYLCPLGAIFTPISAKRLYEIKRNEGRCSSCTVCTGECSMGIEIHNKPAVSSGECIDCMNCVNVCPDECMTANPSPAIAGTTAAVVIAGLAVTGQTIQSSVVSAQTSTGITQTAKTEKSKDEKAFSSSETSGETENASKSESKSAETTNSGNKYKDGTYTGTGQGFRGPVEVSVTVNNGEITDITIKDYMDDTQFFNKAKSSIISRILSTQSINVDAVSGATFSSKGILSAIADALGEEVELNEASGSTGNGMINRSNKTERNNENNTSAEEKPDGSMNGNREKRSGMYKDSGENADGNLIRKNHNHKRMDDAGKKKKQRTPDNTDQML